MAIAPSFLTGIMHSIACWKGIEMLYNSSLGSSSRKARSRLYKGYTRFSKLLHTSRKIARHRHEPLPLLEHQMARPCQTRRKRVAPARGLPADILEAIAEEGDISDPEAFERQHDEQLVGDSEEGTETEVIESEEEDPEEDPTMEDTEVIEESEDEDPEELQLVSEVRVMETDTDLTTEQVMGTALAETVDEGAEGDTEGQPEDDTASEGWETETFAGELAVTTAESTGFYLPPLPVERAPTPPPLPLSPPEGFEELTPEPLQIEAAAPADPAPPPPEPVGGVPAAMHYWVVNRIYQDMAVLEGRLAEARLAEARAQQTAERAAERAARAALRSHQRLRARLLTHRRVTRIELRARVAARSLPADWSGRVSRVDSGEIFRHAMRRVRALARMDSRPR